MSGKSPEQRGGALRRRALLIIALMVASVVSTPVRADHPAAGGWTTAGPAKGWPITDLAYDASSDLLYATLHKYEAEQGAGLYVSADGGETWRVTGLRGVQPTTVDLHPADPSTIYVTLGGGDDRIFKSTDAGATWVPITPRLPGVALHLDPSSPAKLLASCWCDDTPLYRSDDGGATWTPVETDLPATIRGAIVRDAVDSATLYGNMYDTSRGAYVGFYRSTDGGAHWTRVQHPSRFGPGSLKLATSPHAEGDLLGAIPEGPWQMGLFRSADGGNTWTRLSNTGIEYGGSSITLVAFSPTDPATLYLNEQGLYRSTDAGTTWTRFEYQGTPIHADALWLHPIEPRTIVVAHLGITRSTDGGATWQNFTKGFPSDVCIAAPWSRAQPGLRALHTRGGLAVDPRHPATVYAGGDSFGIYRSLDSAQTWAPVRTGLGSYIVNAVAVDASTSAVFAATYGGFWETRNRGDRWSKVDIPGAFTAVAAADDIVYAGSDDGVYVRTDGNWQKSLDNRYLLALAVDPADPATAYASALDWITGLNLLFKTSSAGATWLPLAFPDEPALGAVTDLVVDSHDPDVIYAAAIDRIFKSSTGGLTWIPLPAPSRAYTTVVVDPTAPDHLYAGVGASADYSYRGGGVFHSSDGGLTWRPFNEGLARRDVARLAIAPDGRWLYAATCAGVHSISLR